MNILEPLLFVAGVIGAACLIVFAVYRVSNREDKEAAIIDRVIENNIQGIEDLFLPNAMFCPYCLLYDYWFTGGGSWSPERCPIHSVDEIILWKQMTKKQRKEAARLHDESWQIKFGCHYFNEDTRKLF